MQAPSRYCSWPMSREPIAPESAPDGIGSEILITDGRLTATTILRRRGLLATGIPLPYLVS